MSEVDVIVVDDDPIFGELCTDRLEDAGYRTKLLHGPFGTVNEVRRGKPKLLILDVNMPGVPGEKVAELVQQLRLPDLKIMFMSSLDADALEDVRANVGADSALSKSASTAELVSAVERLIGRP